MPGRSQRIAVEAFKHKGEGAAIPVENKSTLVYVHVTFDLGRALGTLTFLDVLRWQIILIRRRGPQPRAPNGLIAPYRLSACE